MIKNIISTLVKVCISGAILFFLFRNIELKSFWNTVVSVNPLAVIFVALLFITTQVISTYRWQTILSKDIRVPYFKLLSIYWIGMFFNNFLPTMVGGDVIKGYYLYKYTKRGDVAVASIFMDRYSGFSALIAITAIALVPGYKLIAGTGLPGFFVLLIGGYVFMSLVIWVGPLHSWAMKLLARIHLYGINKKIDTLYKVLMGYKKHNRILLTILGCSAFVQTGVIIGYYFLGSGLGMDVPLSYYFLFVPLGTVVSMLPVSLAGLGIREGVFVYLFTMVGATKEQALTLSLMWFTLLVIVSIAGGVEYVRIGKPGGLPEADRAPSVHGG